MIGHKAYYDNRGNKIQLDEIYVVPVEQLFKFFEYVIPELTIDNSERDRIEQQKDTDIPRILLFTIMAKPYLHMK